MRLLFLLSLLFSVTASANRTADLNTPVCVQLGTCMVHNGEVIDMRSPSQIAVAETLGCSMETGRCAGNKFETSIYPKLTPKDFQAITKDNKEKKYFIPLSIKNQDELFLLTSLSLGMIVFTQDQQIMDLVQETKSQRTQNVAAVANLFGREAIFPIVAGAYFVGVVMKDNKLKQVGLFAVSTGLATQLVTEIFKKSFLRVRPNKAENPYQFGEEGSNFSFFSGHVSAAFSLATVIAQVYKDQPLVPYLAYGVATMTAYARMHDKKHWATDVLAGAVAGHLITKIMMRTWENRTSSGGLIVSPMIGPDKWGFSLIYTPVRPDSGKLQCAENQGHERAIIEECLDEIFSRYAR